MVALASKGKLWSRPASCVQKRYFPVAFCDLVAPDRLPHRHRPSEFAYKIRPHREVSKDFEVFV